jgi:hypothetical protein
VERQPTESTADGGFRWPVEQFALDNGLRVVVCEDRTSPIAGVNLWYNVGSRHEPAGKHGFAHLFEHLMFQGSAQVGKAEHFSVLQQVGGSAINATTSSDRTNYYQTVPSAALPTALWLEADRMGSLALTQENLDNQREVVKNERRQRYDNVPYGRWVEILLELAYPRGAPVPPLDDRLDGRARRRRAVRLRRLLRGLLLPGQRGAHRRRGRGRGAGAQAGRGVLRRPGLPAAPGGAEPPPRCPPGSTARCAR